MIRTIRAGVPILALAAALAGCSSSTIDIPQGAEVTLPPTATATPAATSMPDSAPVQSASSEPAATTDEVLDCATVLPIATISTAFALPAGFVTATEQTSGCAWSMAGNSSALTLWSATGAVAESFASQQSSGTAQPSTVGDQAFYRPGDSTIGPAATLVVLNGSRLMTLRSYVGDQAALESLAKDVITAIG